MKKIQGILLSFSLVLLFILTMISESQNNTSPVFKIISVIVFMIPALYSAIPLIQDYKIKRNRNKNRLSDNTFTDRTDDVNNIIKKLSINEHIIEICGNSEKCGKTWIAKKLVDYINHPEDWTKKRMDLPYKVAYYIDLHTKNNTDIDNFLENNTITNKTVLIFDHVEDLNYILFKQSIYHFQLIYILNSAKEYNFFRHQISPFHEKNIDELHRKIRYNYSGIDSITESEIQALYRLTEGNIGQIHFMLSSQKTVKWIKDTAAGKQTEYDEEFNKIKILLFIGRYEEAQNRLKQFYLENGQYIYQNNLLYYTYILLKADCEHLLNNYEKALSLLTILEASPYVANNKNYELELYKAHYKKHMWKCNDALVILKQIQHDSYSAKVDSLGILLAKYFVNDLSVPNTEDDSLSEFCRIYSDAYRKINNGNDRDTLKCKRYTSAYLYYKNKNSDLNELLSKINEVIDAYKSQQDRLLANAYFMRGEIFRIYKQYEKAVQDYSKTNLVTVDNNIIVQTNLIVFYLKQCKKVNCVFHSLSANEIINLCRNNSYANKVWNRINSILLNDPNKDIIEECFDNRIMPIL
uniref:Uncharacterized protein n=1 Tax=Eubacterium plexicaudatum ASF492 TaxID=1235802 RepID=N1ZZG5_9FIRM